MGRGAGSSVINKDRVGSHCNRITGCTYTKKVRLEFITLVQDGVNNGFVTALSTGSCLEQIKLRKYLPVTSFKHL